MGVSAGSRIALDLLTDAINPEQSTGVVPIAISCILKQPLSCIIYATIASLVLYLRKV
jgi:hypothetical protein